MCILQDTFLAFINFVRDLAFLCMLFQALYLEEATLKGFC